MIAAQDRIAKAAQTAGIAWRRPSGTVEDMTDMIRLGARFIAHGSDFESVLWSMKNRYEVNFDMAIAEAEKENTASANP